MRSGSTFVHSLLTTTCPGPCLVPRHHTGPGSNRCQSHRPEPKFPVPTYRTEGTDTDGVNKHLPEQEKKVRIPD